MQQQGASESHSMVLEVRGWLKFQLKVLLRPKWRDQVRLPKVEITEPFVALRGSPFFCI